MSLNRPTSVKRKLHNESFPLRESRSEEGLRVASSKTTEQDDSSTVSGTHPSPKPAPSHSVRAQRAPQKHPNYGYTAEELNKMDWPEGVFDVQTKLPKIDYEWHDHLVEPRSRTPVPNQLRRKPGTEMLAGVGKIFEGSAESQKGSMKSRATTMECSLSPQGSASNASSLLASLDNAGGQRSSKEGLEDLLAKDRISTASAKATEDTKESAQTQCTKTEHIPLRILSSAGNPRQQSSREDEKPDSRNQAGSDQPSHGQDQGRGDPQGDRSDQGGAQDNPPPPPRGGGYDPPDDKDKNKPGASKDKGKAKDSDEESQYNPPEDTSKAKQPDGGSQGNPPKDKGKGERVDEDEIRHVKTSLRLKSPPPLDPPLPPPVVSPRPSQELKPEGKSDSPPPLPPPPPPLRLRDMVPEIWRGEGTLFQRITRIFKAPLVKWRSKKHPPGG